METTIENTDQNISDMLIGYSAFKIFDECYEYNENACYIADTPVSLKEFLDGAMLSVEDYRIESVSISDILNVQELELSHVNYNMSLPHLFGH